MKIKGKKASCAFRFCAIFLLVTNIAVSLLNSFPYVLLLVLWAYFAALVYYFHLLLRIAPIFL